MAKAATIAAAIVPATIASKNGIEFRNRRRIKCSCAPTYYLIRPGSQPRCRYLWRQRVANLSQRNTR
jgi:hypothetical protein